MSEIALKEETLKEINKNFTGDGIVLKSSISSCLSSWDYYDTLQLKIASVVRSIAKNHYFRDGNKRTALAVFFLLSEENALDIKDKTWHKVINNIASNNYSVEKIAQLLF